MIHERIAQGVYFKDIAAEMEVHPRTVSRALRRGGIAADCQINKKRESDRRFALPRWWSGGDSNSRSAFAFPALLNCVKSTVFRLIRKRSLHQVLDL
jgi:hypothetical protein